MGRADEFNAGQVGPAAARKMADLAQGLGYHERAEESYQARSAGTPQRLFPVGRSDFMLEPHQQTRSQFAADPRTWWHGRYSEQLPRTGGQRNAGIHVGTFGSTDKRRRDLGPSHKFKGTFDEGPQPWRSFPVRLRGEAYNSPESVGQDEGARWSERPGIHYYRNQVEDVGSISALAPGRQFLQTHPQAIKEAKTAGKPVHSMIEWEARQLGRKEYDPGRPDPATIGRHERLNPSLQGSLFDRVVRGGSAVRRRDTLFNEAFMPSHGGTG